MIIFEVGIAPGAADVAADDAANDTADGNADDAEEAAFPFIDRLVRLMLNIEHGKTVYEWGLESTSEPLPIPIPGLLTVMVPSITKNAPPVEIRYTPKVGVVYLSPKLMTKAVDLIRWVSRRIARYPDEHLKSYIPVEASPHTVLLLQGRVESRTCTFHSPESDEHGWSAETPRFFPSRLLKIKGSKIPHISGRAGFTWYFAPVGDAARIEGIDMDNFNALIASVFVDAESMLNKKEISESHLMKLTGEMFGIPDLPKALCQFDISESFVLVLVGDHFEIAHNVIHTCLGNWAEPPEDDAQKPIPEREANLANHLVGHAKNGNTLCIICKLPLWGNFYAMRDPNISPFMAGICRWCAGCLPASRKDSVERVCNDKTILDVFKGSDQLQKLLRAHITPVHVSGNRNLYLCRSKTPGPGKARDEWILEPQSVPIVQSKQRCGGFACLYISDIKAPSVGWGYIAELAPLRKN